MPITAILSVSLWFAFFIAVLFCEKSVTFQDEEVTNPFVKLGVAFLFLIVMSVAALVVGCVAQFMLAGPLYLLGL